MTSTSVEPCFSAHSEEAGTENPTIVSPQQSTGNHPDINVSQNNQTAEVQAEAADNKNASLYPTPAPIKKDLELEEPRPQKYGGKVWRQMQTDAQSLRWHGLKLLKRLGGGNVSTVYLAEDLERMDENGKPVKVAARVMDWSCVLGDYQRSVYPRLMSIYKAMPPHPNIVRLLKRIVDGQSNYLIQEWCSLGSLRSALSPTGCLSRGMSEGHARDLLHQVCEGLMFLHELNMPHSRLTSDNIVLDKGFRVKLTDYGYPASSCSNCTDDDRHLRYRAPELLRGKPFTAFAADVWSVGVVMYEMLHVDLPYSARDGVNVERYPNMPPLQFRTSLSYPGVLLLKRLLTFNARFRPSLQSVCADPWMVEKSKKPENYAIPPASCDHEQEEHHHHPTTQLRSPEKVGKDGREGQTTSQGSKIRSTGSQAGRTALAEEAGGGLKEGQSVDNFPPVKMRAEGVDDRVIKSKDAQGRRRAQRWSDIFAHHNPSPIPALRARQMGQQGKEQPEVEVRVSEPSPEQRVRDQLMDFLQRSERMRAKFFRYYAGVIPPTCREFPLPPVIVKKIKNKSKPADAR